MKDRFSNRLGYLLATMSMAIGTGNIWRFPRLFAQYGGITFLIPWLLFLFLWSVPLLIAENVMGSTTRNGIVCAFKRFWGEKGIHGGGFIILVSFMIASYYCVVTGWCAAYTLVSLGENIAPVVTNWQQLFDTVISTGPVAFMFHVTAAALAAYVVFKGVAHGIEKLGRMTVPVLFIILIYLVIWALIAVDPEWRGLNHVLTFKPQLFTSPETWIQALSQSAWSTGAGWGLLLTYASRAPKNVDVVENSLLTGLGNNAASLLAGVVVVSIVFGLLPSVDAKAVLASGNTGLSFYYLPQLFLRVTFGKAGMFFFFAALFMAALTSLVSMFELVVHAMEDFGITRTKGTVLTFFAIIAVGTPSTFSRTFMDNQDWVWGVGLIISGAIVWYGVIKGWPLFKKALHTQSKLLITGKIMSIALKHLVPVLFIILLSWWLVVSGTGENAKEWLNPIAVFSGGTCILQWMVGMLVVMMTMKKFGKVLQCQRED